MDHQRPSCKVAGSLYQVLKVVFYYVSRVDQQRTSCKVAESLYQVFKVTLYHVSRVDHQRKSINISESLYQVFKVALSMYQVWMTKEQVVKLLSVYIKCLKLRYLCMKNGSPKSKL